MTIRLTQTIRIAGEPTVAGTDVTLDVSTEASLVSQNAAEWVTPNPAVVEDVTTGLTRSADWVRTIVPEVGPLPFWATNSGATAAPTILDDIGVWRYCQVNEARFWGARRVENLLSESNDLDDTSAWTVIGSLTVTKVTTDADLCLDEVGDYAQCFTLSGGGTTSDSLRQTMTRNGFGASGSALARAVPHTFSIDLRAGTASTAGIRIYISGGATLVTKTVTLTNAWQRFSITGTPDGSSTYSILIWPGASGTVHARRAQLEDLAGYSADGGGNIAPSEYVSRGELVYPTQNVAVYDGAMVDGVKYFTTSKAGSVNATTNVVTAASGLAIADSKLWGLRVEPQATQQVTDSTSMASWTINGGGTILEIAAAAATGADGTTSAIRLTEDTGFSASSRYAIKTFAGLTDSAYVCAQVELMGGTQAFLRVGVKKKDGTTVTAWFNRASGTIGTVGSGGKAYMIPTAAGRYLCALAVNIGTGGTTPEMHVGLASADSGTSYTGASLYLDVWNPQLVQKEEWTTPIRTVSATAVRTGHALALSSTDAIGLNDFSLYGEMHAGSDTGIVGKTSDGVTQSWYYPLYMRATPPDHAHNRCGITIRPFLNVGYTSTLWAVDRYSGEPTQRLKWRASATYVVGDFVVPTATQADNANSRKIYTCTDDGISGASEPTWNTSGFPTVEQTDGTAKWQCNWDNTNQGTYDPNDGVLFESNVASGVRCRMAAWFASTPEMGAAVNGELGGIRTASFPVSGGDGDLKKQMAELRIGRSSTTYAVSNACYRGIRVWSRVLPGTYLLQRTAA